MRVHAIKTGSLVGNKTVYRGAGYSSMFRRPERYEFPVYSYIVEHPEGHIAIDTGLRYLRELKEIDVKLHAGGWEWRAAFRPVFGRLFPSVAEVEREIGPAMQAKGLSAEAVRRVVLTHLDPDHVGGTGHFPNAEIWVHRPEYEFAQTLQGKLRQRPKAFWPAGFDPKLYELDDVPYGPFPKSKALMESGDVQLVPIGGHTISQVGVIVRTDELALFFCADHTLRQDWLLEDWGAGRVTMVSRSMSAKLAAETSRRIRQFVEDVPTVLIPAHDAEAPGRLAAMEPLKI